MTLAIAAVLAIASGTSAAAYVEKGVIGNQASWESAEYQKDWGLAAMNASKAYSLGFSGQNVAVGVMDSGAFYRSILSWLEIVFMPLQPRASTARPVIVIRQASEE